MFNKITKVFEKKTDPIEEEEMRTEAALTIVKLVMHDWSDPDMFKKCTKKITKLVKRHGNAIWTTIVLYNSHVQYIMNYVYHYDDVHMFKWLMQQNYMDPKKMCQPDPATMVVDDIISTEMLKAYYETGLTIPEDHLWVLFYRMNNHIREDAQGIIELIKQYNMPLREDILSDTIQQSKYHVCDMTAQEFAQSHICVWLAALSEMGYKPSSKIIGSMKRYDAEQFRVLVANGLDLTVFIDDFKFVEVLHAVFDYDSTTTIEAEVDRFIKEYKVDIHNRDGSRTFMAAALCSGSEKLVGYVKDLGVELLPRDMLHPIEIDALLSHFDDSLIVPEMLNHTQDYENFISIIEILRKKDIEFVVPVDVLYTIAVNHSYLIEVHLVHKSIDLLDVAELQELLKLVESLWTDESGRLKNLHHMIREYAEPRLHKLVESKCAKRYISN
jgi:hypothetical protein